MKELALSPQSVREIVKRQEFRDFTTRKHYPGRHQLELLINGAVLAKASFDLTT